MFATTPLEATLAVVMYSASAITPENRSITPIRSVSFLISFPVGSIGFRTLKPCLTRDRRESEIGQENRLTNSGVKKRTGSGFEPELCLVSDSLVLFCFCWGYRQLRELLAAQYRDVDVSTDGLVV